MQTRLELLLQIPAGEEHQAAEATLNAVPAECRSILTAYAVALVQAAERATGRLVVVADLPAEQAHRLIRDLS